MKNILILGGNGYIGSRVFDFLSDEGHNVSNVDDMWFGKIHPNSIEKNYKDLTKEYLSNFTHIILLAAHSSVSMCSGSFLPCFTNNVKNFIDLIEKLEDQVLIYASSAAVYGNNNHLVDENQLIASPVNFYDYTKICNDNINYLYPKKKIIGLRLGTVGGFSKNFRNENLMNSVSTASKSGRITITNAENYRSILGMKDLCRVYKNIIEKDLVSSNRIYNITSINSKIIEVGESIKNISKCDLTISNLNTTNYSFRCDNSLFQNEYNFKFEDKIETIYEDIISNLDNIIVNKKRLPR